MIETVLSFTEGAEDPLATFQSNHILTITTDDTKKFETEKMYYLIVKGF